MTYVTTQDKQRLFTKISGTGRPVVLIHGWPLSADSWNAQATELVNNGFQVIAYDRRGFGRSDKSTTGYEYDTLADDLADVMRETEATDATIVGFSMGGGEVARYMSRHGGHGVRQTVLVSSIVPYMLKTADHPDGVDQSVFDGMMHAIKTDRDGFFKGFFKDFYGVGTLGGEVAQDVLDASHDVAMQAYLKATLECVQAFAATDFRKELDAFTVPTLVMHGTSDKIVPIDVTGRAAAKGIARAEMIEIEGAPHGMLVTHADRISRELIEFLNADATTIAAKHTVHAVR